MSDRDDFLALIGQVRRNGAFPDAPLLAVYDALLARTDRLEAAVKQFCEQATVDWNHKALRLTPQLSEKFGILQDALKEVEP